MQMDVTHGGVREVWFFEPLYVPTITGEDIEALPEGEDELEAAWQAAEENLARLRIALLPLLEVAEDVEQCEEHDSTEIPIWLGEGEETHVTYGELRALFRVAQAIFEGPTADTQ